MTFEMKCAGISCYSDSVSGKYPVVGITGYLEMHHLPTCALFDNQLWNYAKLSQRNTKAHISPSSRELD